MRWCVEINVHSSRPSGQGPKANYHIPQESAGVRLWLLPAHMTLSIQLQSSLKPARKKEHFIIQPHASVVFVK